MVHIRSNSMSEGFGKTTPKFMPLLRVILNYKTSITEDFFSKAKAALESKGFPEIKTNIGTCSPIINIKDFISMGLVDTEYTHAEDGIHGMLDELDVH
ncbi:hypothetical protein UY3_16677 [Chelonia mydas]|uniref:Uncharacterized protein n=1 Tax=Chelonia mydas TaxID=8469 RepID=M7ANX8_CHEMY|nr:hypothetical protein UY3_16677 [Chelonia mydas]